MDRRGFLQSLTALAGTLTLDPERLLWVPDRKTIFIAPPPKKPIVLASEDFVYTFNHPHIKVGEVIEHNYRGTVSKFYCLSRQGGQVSMVRI